MRNTACSHAYVGTKNVDFSRRREENGGFQRLGREQRKRDWVTVTKIYLMMGNKESIEIYNTVE